MRIMNERSKYLPGFFALWVGLALSLQITAFLMVFRHMSLRWAIAVEWMAAFVLLY